MAFQENDAELAREVVRAKPALVSQQRTYRISHYERLQEQIQLMRTYPNLSCDLAAYQHLIGADEPYPYWSCLKILEILVEGLGAERIHWGTDWPYLGVQPYPELIRAIREATFLANDQVDKILGLNALEFLS